jgi:hypothetical protein
MSLATNIICSKSKVSLDFKGPDIQEAMKFGFSYIEFEDHVVQYIVANRRTMKTILGISDSVLSPERDSIGELWTAKLLIYDKLMDSQIVFSNNTFSAVVNLNLNPKD